MMMEFSSLELLTKRALQFLSIKACESEIISFYSATRVNYNNAIAYNERQDK